MEKKYTDLHVNLHLSRQSLVPITLMLSSLAAACTPSLVPSPVTRQFPLTPTRSIATCTTPPETIPYSDNIVRIGTHLGRKFDPETLRVLRKSINLANCDNPDVVNGFIPLSVIIDTGMLLQDPDKLKRDISELSKYGFLGFFQIVTALDPNKQLQPITPDMAYKMGENFKEAIGGIDNLPKDGKAGVIWLNKPNEKNGKQSTPETYGATLAAFRKGLGRPTNVTLYMAPLSSANDVLWDMTGFLNRAFYGISPEETTMIVDGFGLHSYQSTPQRAYGDIRDQISILAPYAKRFGINQARFAVFEYGPLFNGHIKGCDSTWTNAAGDFLKPSAVSIISDIELIIPNCTVNERTFTPVVNIKSGDVKLMDYEGQ